MIRDFPYRPNDNFSRRANYSAAVRDLGCIVKPTRTKGAGWPREFLWDF